MYRYWIRQENKISAKECNTLRIVVNVNESNEEDQHIEEDEEAVAMDEADVVVVAVAVAVILIPRMDATVIEVNRIEPLFLNNKI